MAAPSKACFCGRSLAGTVRSNSAGGMDVYLVSVVCCEVEVYASGWSLVQRSPTGCGESSTMRGTWPSKAVAPWQKNKSIVGWLMNDFCRAFEL